MILTFLDTETTGLPDKEPFLSDPTIGPEITEYCLATWNDGNVTDVVHKLIYPRNWRDTCAEDEEGIVRTPDGFPLSFREDAWRAGSAVKWNRADDQLMHRRLPVAQLAGSNPAYDVQIINWELKRNGHPPLPYCRLVDTSSLGVFLLHQGLVQGTGLERLAQFFGIEHEAHTSKGDVMASIAVFEAFVELYYSGPKRMREALEAIAEASPDEGMAEFAKEALT
jgi:DNA polymerase III epsilon subunit-like protein